MAMNVMQRGGNAADAAIAASMVNVVLKPHRTHLGGDMFFLIWRKNQNTVDCLNAGGTAPHLATLDRFHGGIPTTGPLASTVPGFVDGLQELYAGYATLPLRQLLAPAIELAEEGFPVSMRLSRSTRVIPRRPELSNEAMNLAFLKDGRPYEQGERLRQPDLADSLRRIVDDEREGFYGGETAKRIARAYADAGGIIDEVDLDRQQAHWHEPLQTTYQGCDVYEQALPSQGIILLEALNIVENFPLREWGLNHPDAIHVMAEATKMAFADSRRFSADPELESVPVERLLSKEYAQERAREIDLKQARDREPVLAGGGDTTQFVVGDGEMAITLIQSVFSAWGARFVIPGTGILMNNRLRGFHIDPASPNRLEPGKRTVHTLNTFLAVRDGQLVVGGGTPGADFQVQTNLQTLVGVVDWDLDLQSAIDAPRWVSTGGELAMEARFPAPVIEELQSRGHKVKVTDVWDATVSRSQAIASLPDGGWSVGSDLRGEGLALAY
ncbi:MAG: gamma-glutamyltransferase [Dehalococcoidia bacterium]|nr:gamma-glutamyltransferase [Dehalococcoidia bacterium]